MKYKIPILHNIIFLSTCIVVYFETPLMAAEGGSGSERVKLADITYVGIRREGIIKHGLSRKEYADPIKHAGELLIHFNNSVPTISSHGYFMSNECDNNIHWIFKFFESLTLDEFFQIMSKVYEKHKAKDEMVVDGTRTLRVKHLGGDAYDIHRVGFLYDSRFQSSKPLPEMKLWIEHNHEERTGFNTSDEEVTKYMFKVKFLADLDFAKYSNGKKTLAESVYIKKFSDGISRTTFVLPMVKN